MGNLTFLSLFLNLMRAVANFVSCVRNPPFGAPLTLLFYHVKSAQVHAKIGGKTLGSPSDVTVMSESMDNQDSGIYVAFTGTESVKIKEKL